MNYRQYKKSRIKNIEKEVVLLKEELQVIKTKLETKRKPRTTKTEE